MKVKHILAIFLFSWMLTIIGAYGKLVHQPWSSAFFTAGTSFHVLSIVLAIIKLFRTQNFKDFLNS